MLTLGAFLIKIVRNNRGEAKRAHEDYSRIGWDGKLLQSTLIAVSQVKATKKK